MSFDDFDRLYDLAASMHPGGLVTVETFRTVLDQAHGVQLMNKMVEEKMEKHRQQTEVLA